MNFDWTLFASIFIDQIESHALSLFKKQYRVWGRKWNKKNFGIKQAKVVGKKCEMRRKFSIDRKDVMQNFSRVVQQQQQYSMMMMTDCRDANEENSSSFLSNWFGIEMSAIKYYSSYKVSRNLRRFKMLGWMQWR